MALPKLATTNHPDTHSSSSVVGQGGESMGKKPQTNKKTPLRNPIVG